MANPWARVLELLVATVLAGLSSMGFMRIFHPWSYRTEFVWCLALTASHCFLISIFLFVWLKPNEPNNVARMLGGAVLGGLLALFVFPYGFVLILSGSAFVTSCVATLTYAVALNRQRTATNGK